MNQLSMLVSTFSWGQNDLGVGHVDRFLDLVVRTAGEVSRHWRMIRTLWRISSMRTR